MNEEFIIIDHSNLTDEYLDIIINLKQQHWNHPYDSQKKWIYDNLYPDDIHLILKIDGVYAAYMSICNIDVTIDGNSFVAKGLGNVCVDLSFQKKGLGKRIVEKANEIITRDSNAGILLCHSHLMPFYQRCGWFDVQYKAACIGDNEYDDVVMLYNCNANQKIEKIAMNRSF